MIMLWDAPQFWHALCRKESNENDADVWDLWGNWRGKGMEVVQVVVDISASRENK